MQTIQKERVHFAFCPEQPPQARGRSGEIFIFECQDCYCGQLNEDGMDFSQMDMSRNNPATGPLYIEDAMPGDILRVEILYIKIAAEGAM